MAEVTIHEGGAIPYKQAAAFLVALGRADEVGRLDGRLADLLHNSTYVVSAWDGATLVGAARVVSDGVAVAILEHIGVHPDYQHHGLGGALLGRCLARYGHIAILALVDDPADTGFYARFGFRLTGRGWPGRRNRSRRRERRVARSRPLLSLGHWATLDASARRNVDDLVLGLGIADERVEIDRRPVSLVGLDHRRDIARTVGDPAGLAECGA
jgi:GNAT superfamily N-acetyltransferase